MISEDLIKKYNVPTPRYTSYPTVPMWTENAMEQGSWKLKVSEAISKEKFDLGLYIHLPFCESLCTFCGCNKRITRNHDVEEVYINALVKEWKLYQELFGETPDLHELHLGGGTPTFFKASNLEKLLSEILSSVQIPENNAFSFEGNPRNTTPEQLKALKDLHFTRASYGIQDFDPRVQDVINRIQSFELVRKVVDDTRSAGFTAINFDLVYGLPFQTIESIDQTFEKVGQLRPDRIAFYSYAHVPWIKGVGQRKFSEEDIPQGDEKRALYNRGRAYLSEQGYVEIGMDHFALQNDELYKAQREGKLFRNFMGYTVFRTRIQLGLGVSSISDTWNSFAQNEKVLEDYYSRLENNEIPVTKGHFLNDKDKIIRQCILDLMCKGQTQIPNGKEFADILKRLQPMTEDHLLTVENGMVTVLDSGMPFIRNICTAFDLRLWEANPQTRLFSMSI